VLLPKQTKGVEKGGAGSFSFFGLFGRTAGVRLSVRLRQLKRHLAIASFCKELDGTWHLHFCRYRDTHKRSSMIAF
jgi:hypothetical protein